MPKTNLVMSNKPRQSVASLNSASARSVASISRQASRLYQRKEHRQLNARLDKLADQMTNVSSHIDDVSDKQNKSTKKIDNVDSNVTESTSYNLHALLPQINKLVSASGLLQTDVKNLNTNTEHLINMKKYELGGIGAGFILLACLLIF